MVFSSTVFLFLFLPLVLLLYFSIRSTLWKNAVLLISSLFFYAWGEPVYVFLMILSCGFNYVMGLWVGRSSTKKPLALAIALNVLVLCLFKYADFIVENVNALAGKPLLDLPQIALPIGISFFTFQAISYLIDVSKSNHLVQRNPFKLSLYIALFPQLIAGPIVRYQHIVAQLGRRTHHIRLFTSGLRRFILGLSKKVLVANAVGTLADSIFENPTSWSTPNAWIGILAYSLQIYYDFSGYSDMAIGLGRMFGFRFLENFRFPYSAASIQDFWRRWHISLSTWFRDYLYIPLGGNRAGATRTYINLIIVFFITGLWHGASWNFVFWGLFHGFFLLVERAGFSKFLFRYTWFGHLYTLLVVMVAWVFFRLTHFGEAIEFTGALFGITETNEITAISNQQFIFLIIGCVFAINWLPKKWTHFFQSNSIGQSLSYVGLFFLLLFCLLDVANSTYNPFIYYRF